jgi:hypothetical protein
VDWVRGEEVAGHETISGKRPTKLLWFPAEESFLEKQEVSVNKQRTPKIPRYPLETGLIFKPIWLKPADDSKHGMVLPTDEDDLH